MVFSLVFCVALLSLCDCNALVTEKQQLKAKPKPNVASAPALAAQLPADQSKNSDTAVAEKTDDSAKDDDGKCMDASNWCGFYAGAGMCAKAWEIARLCAKSCGVCHLIPPFDDYYMKVPLMIDFENPHCKDIAPDCWKSVRMCENKQYMPQYLREGCKFTCRLCE